VGTEKLRVGKRARIGNLNKEEQRIRGKKEMNRIRAY